MVAAAIGAAVAGFMLVAGAAKISRLLIDAKQKSTVIGNEEITRIASLMNRVEKCTLLCFL